MLVQSLKRFSRHSSVPSLFLPLNEHSSALRACFSRHHDKSKSILDEFFVHPDSEAGQASALSFASLFLFLRCFWIHWVLCTMCSTTITLFPFHSFDVCFLLPPTSASTTTSFARRTSGIVWFVHSRIPPRLESFARREVLILFTSISYYYSLT